MLEVAGRGDSVLETRLQADFVSIQPSCLLSNWIFGHMRPDPSNVQMNSAPSSPATPSNPDPQDAFRRPLKKRFPSNNPLQPRPSGCLPPAPEEAIS